MKNIEYKNIMFMLFSAIIVYLKIIGEIKLSWWLVLLPIYGESLIVIICFIIYMIIRKIKKNNKKNGKRKSKK